LTNYYTSKTKRHTKEFSQLCEAKGEKDLKKLNTDQLQKLSVKGLDAMIAIRQLLDEFFVSTITDA